MIKNKENFNIILSSIHGGAWYGKEEEENVIKMTNVEHRWCQSTNVEQSSLFSRSQLFSESDFFSKTSSFSDSKKVSSSEKFTISSHFTNSGKFSRSNYFIRSNGFSSSEEFSSSKEFTDSDNFGRTSRFTLLTFLLPVILVNSDISVHLILSLLHNYWAGLFKLIIQIICLCKYWIIKKRRKYNWIATGIVAAVAAMLITALMAFFIFRNRKKLPTNGIDLMNETNSSITVDNSLQTAMNEDDPFLTDF